MRVIVGTSGYSYQEWKGSFYPETLPAPKMLPFYASHFGAVEINNTFYRMPAAKTLEKWAEDVPEGFTFAIKAPQRITHQKKLAGAADDVGHLFDVAAVLGAKLGPVLFQLPPWLRKDAERLREFTGLLRGRMVAFEFRHVSWFDEEVFGILRGAGAALCAADTDEVPDSGTLIHPTADWGYLRLRRSEYSARSLAAWRERIANQGWDRAYVFFKHEDEAKGPRFARDFLAAAGA